MNDRNLTPNPTAGNEDDHAPDTQRSADLDRLRDVTDARIYSYEIVSGVEVYGLTDDGAALARSLGFRVDVDSYGQAHAAGLAVRRTAKEVTPAPGEHYSYLPIDVGFDPRTCGISVNLPADAGAVTLDDDGIQRRVEGSRSELVEALRDAGYTVAEVRP